MAPDRRIVLISDDPRNDGLPSALRRAAPGHTLVFASSREELEHSPAPSLILLDLPLEHDSLCNLLRWLRTDRSFKSVPVFAVASPDVNELIEEAYALGANSCFLRQAEPAALDRIAQGIATYLNVRSAPSEYCFA